MILMFSYSRCDPVRSFISGHVANSMATEVIALLHGLMKTKQNEKSIWLNAVEKVL